MKALSITVVIASLFMIAAAPGADKSKKSPTLPAYPHQRNINIALKQLTNAQKKAGSGGSEQADAVIHLKKAEIALDGAKNNKGSFLATAHRLTGQAIRHLEKGEVDTANHEIAEAIEAVHKAGKAGEK